MRVRMIPLIILVLLAAAPVAAALPPGGTFIDDDGSIHEADIEAIAAAEVTRGCNETGDRFCPTVSVTRGQMAAFLARLLDLSSIDSDTFVDDDQSVFEPDIEAIAAAGITTGCTTQEYCPSDPVTRGEMAVFLVRAFDLPPSGADAFADDSDSPYQDAINAAATAGMTNGCAAGLFCPQALVTREQMASFLVRASDLEPIGVEPRCSILPADNIWNTPIDTLPTHANSDAYVASIGLTTTLHPDFGSGVWPPGSDSPIGIPYVEVGPDQTLTPVNYVAYGDESDPGPFPIPLDASIEGGPDGTGDRHVIAVDRTACMLYELFDAMPVSGAWQAASGATYDLSSNALRPLGWTSADAAGLPIFPGLVRYEEVAAGSIDHAIRFTAARTQQAFVWPARHFASTNNDPLVPPMGQRFRLRSDFDTSSFSPDVGVILGAMKQYGLILADNGSNWYVSGAPDARWDNDVLGELKTISGSAFEAVDVSGLMVTEDSGVVRP